MKTAFFASYCWYGLQGGALKADDRGLIFRMDKLSVPEHLKKILMPYDEIAMVKCCRAGLFPAVEIYLGDGDSHKIAVFNRSRLLALLTQHGVLVEKENGEMIF